jgi:hypothetical protein
VNGAQEHRSQPQHGKHQQPAARSVFIRRHSVTAAASRMGLVHAQSRVLVCSSLCSIPHSCCACARPTSGDG